MKELIKFAFQLAAIVTVAPLLFLHFLVLMVTKDGLFVACSQLLSLLPGKTGSYCRVAFYRFAMMHCDPDCSIGFGTVFSQIDTEIHKGVYIGPQCNIGMCKIGANTLLGSGVHVMSGSKQHDISDTDIPIKEQGGVFEKVEIGMDCWVGNCSLILADVGAHCVVGAGSVVVKPIDESSIVAGNPARMIKER